MKKIFVVMPIVSVTLILPSCRSRNETSETLTNSDSEVEIQFDQGENKDKDLPTGHSLFDQLRGSWRHFPNSYEDFKSKVAEFDNAAMVDSLFGSSRSLQKNSINEKNPRIVSTTSFHPDLKKLKVDSERQLLLDHRIFFGYAKKSDSLEVISFNDTMGRFEFQVVHHLSDPKRRKVLYAPRSQCLSCHFNGGPIFPTAQWTETNANKRVAKLISEANESERYLGVKISTRGERPKRAFVNDRAVKQAMADWLVTRTTWNKLCQNESCRIKAVSSALDFACGKNDALAEWKKQMKTWNLDSNQFRLYYGDPRIVNRTIDQKMSSALDPRNQNFIYIHSKQIVNDWPKIAGRQLLRLATKSICDRDVSKRLNLKIANYDPEVIVQNLLLKPSKRSRLPKKEVSKFIKPELEAVSGKPLETYRYFCGSCHSFDDEIGFLKGTDQNVRNSLSVWKKRIDERLELFEHDATGQMPPEGSSENTELRAHIKHIDDLKKAFEE